MKLFWSDILRVISIFAVVLLHVSAYVVVGIKDTTSLYWWIGNFADSSVRWCVPILLMISGALLLDPSKEEDVLVFYKKRAARILFPILFWTLFSFLFIQFSHKINLKMVWFNILTGAPYPHLWYLYMILGLYLITPFLRTYVKYSSNKERTIFICFIFVIAIAVTIIKYFLFQSLSTIFTMFIPYTGYYLSGYQFRRFNPNRVSYTILLFVIAMCLIITVCCTGYTAMNYGLSMGLYFYDYFSPTVIIMSVAIFLMVRKRFSEEKQKVQAENYLIKKIVPATLGIYIIHYFILDSLWIFFKISPVSFNPLLSIPLFASTIFFVSFAIVFVINKIPYLRLIV